MKKTLSILLIATMLLSMILVAIPVGAEEEITLPVTEWEKPWLTDSSWIEIKNAEEFKAKFVRGTSANDVKKYYLSGDIVIDTSFIYISGENYSEHFILDGNGYSFIYNENSLTALNKLRHCTIRNLILEGDFVARNENGPGGRPSLSPIGGFGWQDNVDWTATNIKFENVRSDVDMILSQSDKWKAAAGLIMNVGPGSSFTNVSFTGSITTNATLNSGAMIDYLGGIVGRAWGYVTFDKCTTNATINIAKDSIKLGFSEGNGAKVALLCAEGENTSFTDCVTSGSIYVGENSVIDNGDKRALFVGAMIGYSGVRAYLERCTNNASVTLAEEAAGATTQFLYSSGGCLVGRVNGSSEFKDCTNNGDLTVLNANGSTHGYGCFVGFIYNNSENKFTNCVNTGSATISSNDGGITGIAGFVGIAFGEGQADLSVTFTNCTNEGIIQNSSLTNPDGEDVEANRANNKSVVHGGFIGEARCVHALTFNNCVNKGDVLKGQYDVIGTFYGSAGFVGRMRIGGASWTLNVKTITTTFNNCINSGDIYSAMNAAGFVGNSSETLYPDDTYSYILNYSGCLNTGDIYAPYAAGIHAVINESAGVTTVNIDKCVNAGDINGQVGVPYTAVGGMLGWIENGEINVTNCLNSGNVFGHGQAGGIGGNNSNTSNVSYIGNINVGNITGTMADNFVALACGSNTRSKNIALNGSVDDKSGRVRFVEIEAIDEAVAELGIFASYGFDRIEEKIAEIEGEELKAHKYAEFTWNALINKLNAAKAILKTNIMVVASDNVTVNKLTQEEVNKAYYDLVAARAGLVTINQMPIAIDNAIKDAEALFESDVVYTTASWNKFIAALNAVKKYQAVEDINKVDPVEIGNAITALTNAKNTLVKGGDIYTGADFAKLKDQEGVFNLMADITITEDVDSFKGVLKGNGHTITLDGCNLFDKLDGATVANLVVKGTANASVFGKAVNKVTLSFVYVDLDCGLDYAILFDECASAAEIKLTGVAVFANEATYAAIADVDCKIDMNIVVADVDAPALTTSENVNYKGAYLVGVEGFGTGKELPLGDGSIAYSLNVAIRSFANNAGSGCLVDEFKALTLVQVLGDDAYPVVGPFAVDGTNVVAPVYANGAIVGYKNEAIKYEDETPVIPVEPIAPIAPVTSGLQESITEAEALVEANYTADTWTALKNALAAAKAALTADGQAAIDDAKYALDIAIIGLEKVAPAAPTPLALDALNAAIAAAEAKNAGEYTTGSWSAVKAALLAAKRAKLADQAAVDAATAALNAAVAALVEAPAPEAPVISKPETNAPATEEEGCGGIIGGAAVVLTAVVALGAGVSFKKKED